MVQLGSKLAQRLHVVAVAESVLHDQSLAARLLQDKFQFVGAEAEIEVDQHNTSLGGGELHQHPLRDVSGPDSNPVATFKSQGHQAAGGALYLGLQFAPVEAQVLLAKDESGGFRIARGHLIENLADAKVDQRWMVRTSGVAGGSLQQILSHHNETPFPASAHPELRLLIIAGKIIRGAYSVLNFWNTESGQTRTRRGGRGPTPLFSVEDTEVEPQAAMRDGSCCSFGRAIGMLMGQGSSTEASARTPPSRAAFFMKLI